MEVKRKIPIKPKKINARFHLGDQTFLTFGFGKELEVEIRLCRKNARSLNSFRFDATAWEALSTRIGPLSGWTTCHDATSFDAILRTTSVLIVSAHATHNNLKFEILIEGRLSHEFSINALEAGELNRIMSYANLHIEKIREHNEVINLMFGITASYLRRLYDLILPDFEYNYGFQDVVDHQNFDIVMAHFSMYVSPFTIISEFENQLSDKKLTCDFQSFNVFSIVMGQLAFLKAKLMNL